MSFDVNADKPLDEIAAEIIRVTREVTHAWGDGGCAPSDAAKLLSESRLDWLLSLSHTLRQWTLVRPTRDDHDGMLILAWANLGSLVEGWLKMFLCVYLADYRRSVRSKQADSIYKKLWEEKKAEAKDADALTLDVLREFFRAEVWEGTQEVDEWDQWLRHLQGRRNAIHAFKNRPLGTFDDFRADVRIYREFLHTVTSGLPDFPCEPR